MVARAHRIRRAAVTCEAPRGSPARQAAADRLARRLRRALAPALAAALPANERYYVIDHLACGDIDLSDTPEATRVRVLAKRITAQIAAAGNERRVWTFDSEADYVAAFASAHGQGRIPSAPVWSGLRGCARATALEAALAATAERDLDLGDVLARLARRIDLTEVVLRAPQPTVDLLLRGLAARPDQSSEAAGTAALSATAQRILTAARVAGAADPRVASAIRSEPVDWRDPGALADAVSRGVIAGLGGRGRASFEIRASARPAVARAVRTLAWLDGDRLLRRLSAGGRPLAPTARVEATLRALHDALQAVAGDLSSCDDHVRAVGGPDIALLWNVRFRGLHPGWRDDPLPFRLLTAVTTGSGGVLEASHSPIWKAVEALWIGLAAGPIPRTSRSPALQTGQLADPGLPVAQNAAHSVSLPRETRASVPTDLADDEGVGLRRPATVSPDAPAADRPTHIEPSGDRARPPGARREPDGARPATVVNPRNSQSPALQTGQLADPGLPVAQNAAHDVSLTRDTRASVPTDLAEDESVGHRRPATVSPDAPAADRPTHIEPSGDSARPSGARREPEGARPATVVNHMAAKDDAVQVTPVEAQKGVAAQTLVATRAAGLFLLWRTLVDIRFGATLRVTADGQEDTASVLRSSLWSLALATSGLAPDIAEEDQGARHFARLAAEDPAPDPLDAVTEATLLAGLRSAPALRSRGTPAPATLSDAVLGAFAFWLRGFEHSSPSFVCHRFLRRPGRLWVDGPRVGIEMAPLPFDVVLDRAGYLDPLALPDWLGGLRVHFSVGGGL